MAFPGRLGADPVSIRHATTAMALMNAQNPYGSTGTAMGLLGPFALGGGV
jgi:hypothetical protein